MLAKTYLLIILFRHFINDYVSMYTYIIREMNNIRNYILSLILNKIKFTDVTCCIANMIRQSIGDQPLSDGGTVLYGRRE